MHSPSSENPPPCATGTPAADSPDQPATILLVDDDSSVRESLRRVLTSDGLSVVTAALNAL
jgi:response regulator RpfG family c-di-GMP phosphodiesterase